MLLAILPLFLIVPGPVSAAPTAGDVRAYLCPASPNDYCPEQGVAGKVGSVVFNGSLNLNGGSYEGVFRVAIDATEDAAGRYRFGNAPVQHSCTNTPFEVPFFGPLYDC
jgi:hypothetical protein